MPTSGLSGFRPLSAACLLVVVAALASMLPASAVSKGIRRFGGVNITTVSLTNGSGPGKATAVVDGYGAFGTEDGGRSLRYQPVNAASPSETTFFSGLWFSGVNKAGQGGQGEYLDAFALGDIGITKVAENRATSQFTREGLRFDLVQEMLATSNGSTFLQRYTITNQNAGPASFDLIRHFDGDLQFDGSLQDVGGVSANGKLVFQFDSNAGGGMGVPATFVGIDFEGEANLGFRISAFDDDSGLRARTNIRNNGRLFLNNTLTDPDGANADANGDGITDTAYDVTINLGNTYSIPAGAQLLVVTRTFLGEGNPDQLVRAPSNLRGSSPAFDRVNLEWDDNSANEAGFAVERRTEPDGAFAEITRTGPGAVSFADTGLSAQTTYTYRVRAFFGDGQLSAYSNEFSVSTGAGPVTVNPPSNLRTTAVGQTSADLQWDDQSDNETSFEVERSDNGGPFNKIATPGAGVVTFADTGLSAETSYVYRVRAVRDDGKLVTRSPFSNELTVVTLPPAPGNLQAAAGGPSSIILTWQDRSVTETQFRIEKQTGKGFTEIGTAPADATSFTVSDLPANTSFTFRVRASAPQGFSPYSNEATARTAKDDAPPRFVAPTPRNNREFEVVLGESVEFEVKGEDPNPGDQVRLTAQGIPAGATLTPSLPLTGNPVSTRFRWTPTEADLASSPVTVTFVLNPAAGEVTGPFGKENSITRSIKIKIIREETGVCSFGKINSGGVKMSMRGSFGWPRGSRNRLKGYVSVNWSSSKKNLRATRLESLRIQGGQAVLSGLATVNGVRNVPFTMTVLDGGPGPNDRLIELIVGDERWPSGALQSADVHIHRNR